MSNNTENQPISTAMQKMNPTQEDAHRIGIELADAAFLHDAGTQGMTAEKLQKRWEVAYTLGRSGVEHALGAEKPYAADRIDQLRIANDKPAR
jgi:hypothetical protein